MKHCTDCSIELTTDEEKLLKRIGNKCASKEYRNELLRTEETDGIKLIQQNETDCTLACIAMVGRITLDKVHKIFPEFDGKGTTSKETIMVLDRLKIPHILYASDSLYYGRLYMLVVPSVNILGNTHNIVVVNKSDGSTIILDPNNGRDGKKFYSEDSSEVNAVELKSWCDPIEIVI